MTRCINLRDWESRRLLSLAAGETAVLVRPVDARGPYAWEDRRGMPWPYDTTRSHGDDGEPWMPCPFGRPGDTLIGREVWAYPLGMAASECTGPVDIKFRASACEAELAMCEWRSAATMPAWAARLRLTIVSVEVFKCTAIVAVDEYDALEPKDPVLQSWDKKRFPWATSHAWVLTVRIVARA